MDKIFAEIFAKQPDETINGDYFYHTLLNEELSAKISVDVMKMPLEKLRERREKNWLGYGDTQGVCKMVWEHKTLQDEVYSLSNPLSEIMLCEEYEFSMISKIFSKIADEGKPFMDISSSHSFGLIPFIVKMNPQILCMATDIDSHLIKCLRLFVNRDLAEYNINLASFDNNDIPIKDNSLDYITSTFGIALGCEVPFFSVKDKTIREIYRILKPGGCFVTIEPDIGWKFDSVKIHEVCNHHVKLFGTYGYDEIKDIANELDKVKASSWRDQFIAEGFQIEIEERYPQKVSTAELTTKLKELTHQLKIRKWTDDEIKEYKAYYSSVNFDETAEDYGIECTKGKIFYVLRKII